MKPIYETGATSHAINDLILWAENTKELTMIRDSIYSRALSKGDIINLKHKDKGFSNDNFYEALSRAFHKLLIVAKLSYIEKFPNDSHHITDINYSQKQEFCNLYAEGFKNWCLDNSKICLR